MNIEHEQLVIALPAWRTSDVTGALLRHLNQRKQQITAAAVENRLTAPAEQIADNLSRIAAFDEILRAVETGAFITTNQPNK